METSNTTSKNNTIIDLDDLRDINRFLLRWEKYPTKTIMDHLIRLKGVSISKSELKETHIHKSISILSKIKTNSAEKRSIKNLAAEIRNVWKKALNSTNGNADGDSDNDENQGQDSNIKKPELSLIRQMSEDTRLLRDLPELNDTHRNHALKRFVDLFSDKEVKHKVFTLDPNFDINSQVILNKCLSMEREICSFTTENEGQNYIGFIRNRILLLKEKSNLDLRVRIIMDDLSIEDFVKASIEELSLKAKKLREEAFKFVAGASQSDFSLKNAVYDEGEFTCFKCRGKKIILSQRQMRSADEPMTVFHFCVDCGNRWKTN